MWWNVCFASIRTCGSTARSYKGCREKRVVPSGLKTMVSKLTNSPVGQLQSKDRPWLEISKNKIDGTEQWHPRLSSVLHTCTHTNTYTEGYNLTITFKSVIITFKMEFQMSLWRLIKVGKLFDQIKVILIISTTG